jgi:hypothetical protein
MSERPTEAIKRGQPLREITHSLQRGHPREDVRVDQRHVLWTLPNQLRQQRLFATLTHHWGHIREKRSGLAWWLTYRYFSRLIPRERSNKAKSLRERLARPVGVVITRQGSEETRERSRGRQR